MTTDQKQANRVSKQLPFDIRAALERAALTPVTEHDPQARVKAIEAVQARARAHFPKLFRD